MPNTYLPKPSDARFTYQDALVNALAWMEAAMWAVRGTDVPRGKHSMDEFGITCDIIGALCDARLSGTDAECSISRVFEDGESLDEMLEAIMDGCSLGEAFTRGGE